MELRTICDIQFVDMVNNSGVYASSLQGKPELNNINQRKNRIKRLQW